MASIPQINNPVTGKSYTSGLSGRNSGDSEEQFDLIQLAKPLDVNQADERESGGDQKAMGRQKDFMSMSVKIAKDPTMAVESLKQLVSEELLSMAKANGYTELYGELDSLMKGLYLKPDNLVSDIVAQEKQNTMFTGSDFFDLLRELVAGASVPGAAASGAAIGGDEMKTSVGNILKAINYMLNKDEILTALSSNMKFLSRYFAPNKGLSESLSRLSGEWAAPEAGNNFDSLKNQTLDILKNVSESLLNNEQTQVLIPLIVHNLSRYNTNSDMLMDYLAQLLTQIPGGGMKDSLVFEFENFMNSYFNRTGEKSQNGEAPTNSYNTTFNNTTNSEINQPLNSFFIKDWQIPDFLATRLEDGNYISLLNYTAEDFDAPVKNYLLGKTDGLSAVNDIISVLIRESGMKNVLAGEISRIGNIEDLVNYLNQILQSMPDTEERGIIYENLVEIVNNMAENEELPAMRGEDTATRGENTATRGETSAKQSTGAEKNTAGENVGEKIPENPREHGRNQPAVNRRDHETDRETHGSVNRNMNAEKGNTALKGLIDFVDRNIDHSALKSINNYNASNLLQSLINAPGVFTPLAHYIIPLQIEDTKAFGELWVDKDEENAAASVNGGNRKYHLFLTFEVEEIGRFEVDLYALGDDVNISFMHPIGFDERVNPLVRKVNRFIAQAGYVTRSFKTAPLAKPHNLTQIFPHINEKRSGFDVKA